MPLHDLSPGGGVSQVYLGYNTIGSSSETFTTNRVLVKQVTLPSAGLITSIEAHVRTNTADHAGTLNVGLFSDSSGSPDLIISNTQQTITAMYLSKAGATNGTYRWLGGPVAMWLAAGSYWLAVQHIPVTGAASMDIHYDATGADRYMTPSFNGTADWNGLYAPTTSANQYSIRAAFIY